MSAYYTRYCAEHGDYDADVDGDQECEKCFKEGKTRPQKDAARIAELERELTDAQSRLREEAARIDWMESLFSKSWNGVIDSGSRTHWMLSGPYRHAVAKMQGTTFREAIDAALFSGREKK